MGEPSVALNVLYLVSTLADSGPVNVLWGIVRHLDRREFRPVIVTLSPEPESSSIHKFRNAGVEIHQLNISRTASLWKGKKLVRDAIASANADLIHCHGIRATLLAAGESSRHLLVATLHCDLEHYYQLTFGRYLGRIIAKLEYHALRKFRLVTAVGQSLSDVARGYRIQSSVIANGIDLDTFFPPRDESEKRRIREKIGWPTDSVVVLHTGMLNAGKRPVRVIEDFLAAYSPSNSVLMFAGDGPLRERCIQAANSSNRVIFLGWRTNVPDLLKAADILISNSESEGFPLALLEGCASGLLVLATDIPPHRAMQKMFPQQVMLFRDKPQYPLELALAQVAEKSYVHASPPEEALETISDRRMSQSYQLAYRGLVAER
jgi:glycosyltransferase involved in cell wall biosynthesis